MKWKTILTVFFGIVICWSQTEAMNLRLEIDLSGDWRFEIGDNPAYSKFDFNDKSWEVIHVPNMWENEGFPGYDGYAWYRLHFSLPAQLKDKILYLKLGQIDDVDRAYVNGHCVGGEGSFPPKYQTAYDVKRIYKLDKDILNFGGENVIAVQVLDTQLGGGIVDGEVGIYSRQDVLNLNINLSGNWKFKTGNDLSWAGVDYDDCQWTSIPVPGSWENEGFEYYNGIAWYRKTIRIDRGLTESKLILMLGEIDDIDEVYFNGILIGHTGWFPRDTDFRFVRGYNDVERAYLIPPQLIRAGKDNFIAVRVLDRGGLGGITRGYVGITTRDNYLKYAKNKKE